MDILLNGTGAYQGKPVSIKTKKDKCAIEMGDLFRNYPQTEDFYLIVGFWNDSKSKQVTKEYIVLIDHKFWNTQFNENLVEEYKTIFDGVTNSRSDDNIWRARRTEAVNKWKETDSVININFKRDHKRQKRVQCSIKYNSFIEILYPKFRVDLQPTGNH